MLRFSVLARNDTDENILEIVLFTTKISSWHMILLSEFPAPLSCCLVLSRVVSCRLVSSRVVLCVIWVKVLVYPTNIRFINFHLRPRFGNKTKCFSHLISYILNRYWKIWKQIPASRVVINSLQGLGHEVWFEHLENQASFHWFEHEMTTVNASLLLFQYVDF